MHWPMRCWARARTHADPGAQCMAVGKRGSGELWRVMGKWEGGSGLEQGEDRGRVALLAGRPRGRS